jgi:hypothetical protein
MMAKLLDVLYPSHCPSTGRACLLCPEPSRLLVCLPADTVTQEYDEFAQRLTTAAAPYVVVGAGALNGGHFPLWHRPDEIEAGLLLLSRSDPDYPHLGWCAGGPVGLLDLATTAHYLDDSAIDQLESWRALVAGTPPAQPWRHYLQAHRRDPHDYPMETAVRDFAVQPRVTAMREAHDAQYDGDLYGPGLEALHGGDDIYANYATNVLVLGDGLITLDGRLLAPVHTRALVEQPLAELRDYHQQAHHYLRSLHPGVVVAALCDLTLAER